MRAKTVAVGLSAAALALAGLQAVQPRTPTELEQQQRQSQVEQLSDNQDRVHEHLRRDGNQTADADRLRRLVPVEPRSGHVPAPRLRLP